MAGTSNKPEDTGEKKGFFLTRWFHGLYQWVMHWADTPHAEKMLGILSFAESSFFPIPPDVLLIPMGISRPDRAIRFAAVTSVASILGGMMGYVIGFYLFDAVGIRIIEFYGYMDKYILFQEWFEKYNFAIIMVAGLTPLPYKVFTITAGVAGVNFPIFVLGSVLSRSTRFMAEGIVCYYGDFFSQRIFKMPIRDVLDKYINLFGLSMAALGVAGFLVVKVVIPGYEVDISTQINSSGASSAVMLHSSPSDADSHKLDYTLTVEIDGSSISAEIPGGPYLVPSRGEASINHVIPGSGDAVIATTIFYNRPAPEKGTNGQADFFLLREGKMTHLESLIFPGYELQEGGVWIEGSLDYLSAGEMDGAKEMIEVRLLTISHAGLKGGEVSEDFELFHFVISDNGMHPLK
jgi:membrane protein YqaA with SNARE-associated domain